MHKIDKNKPHWMDFYARNEQNIKMVEIKPKRHIAVLELPRKDIKNASYAFFIHGSCARMGQFDSLIEQLAPNFHIVAFDRIGCGVSDKPVAYDTYSAANIFYDLCALFTSYIPQSSTLQNKRHAITIIGHSFGCLQAMKLVAKYGKHPNHNYLLDSVILIGAPSLCIGDNLPLVARGLFSLPYWLLDRLSPSLSDGFRKNGIHADSKSVHALEETFAGHNKPFMFAVFYSQIVPCSEEEFEAFCAAGVNVLVVHGESDKIVPVKQGEDLLKKMKASKARKLDNLVEFEVMSGVSHQCMQEDPKTLLQILEAFWTKCSTRYSKVIL